MPADPCSPQTVATDAKCFTCLPEPLLAGMEVYLLGQIWKVLNPAADVTPASLAKAASCYMKCASGKLLLAEQVYLLCQLVEQTQPG